MSDIDASDGGQIKDAVFSIVVQVAQCDATLVRPDTRVADLGLDSMGLTAIAAFLETTLSCALSEQDQLALFEAETVDDLLQVTSRSIRSAQSSCISDNCEAARR